MPTDERVAPRVATAGSLFLETKLTRPPVRSEHVSRQQFVGRLRTGEHRLTLIAAPPGFGKTTLLAEWADAADGPPIAWFSVDEDDNDLPRFVAYLAESLRRLVPGVGARALAAVRTPTTGAADLAVTLLANDVAALDHTIVLVIDDYHLITSPEVHSTVARLVEAAPSTFRLVLATRENPPLPLGRLRACGELEEIRADDLRFSDDLAATFLTDVLGLDLTTDDVERLQARTEGWPAALYLAALSLRGQPDPGALIDRFAGDDRFVVDYLTAEILARQSPARRRFLLCTSVLHRFCAGLADAVLENEDSAKVLAELERSNLLLIPLDRQREWYRYHHLFGDLLRHELVATEPLLVASLHRRASEWYRTAGLIAEAAHHAVAAGDVDAAVQLVASHFEIFVDRGQLATVLRWLAQIPRAVAARDWRSCVAGTIASAHAGLLDEAEQWLELAEHAPRTAPDDSDRDGRLAALRAYLRLLRGDIGATVEHARNALTTPPASDEIWALGPKMVLASGLWWSGQPTDAAAIVDDVARTALVTGLDAMAVYALGVRAAIALDDQDDDEAETLAASAIDLMHRAELDEHPWAAMAHVVQGTLLGRRGQMTQADDEIERGRELGHRQAAWQVTVSSLLALAELRQRQHQPSEARRMLARARDLLDMLPDPGDGHTRLTRAAKTLRVRTARGRHAEAPSYWELTARELDVLRLLPSRLSQREIATQLSISFNTVTTHTGAIFRKLNVNSRADAVTRAKELGLLER